MRRCAWKSRVGLGRASHDRPGADPELFQCFNVSDRSLVCRAYGVEGYQVAGPDWMDGPRFDLAAKVPSGTSIEHLRLMQQALLAGL